MIQIKPTYLVDHDYNLSYWTSLLFQKAIAMPIYFTRKIIWTRNIASIPTGISSFSKGNSNAYIFY
jgi:hypothetical protein